MFQLFKRGFRRGGTQPSPGAVRFETTGYEAHGEPQPGKVRVCNTPEGDGLGMYFFPVPPDLPANAASVDELASFYQRLLGESGGKLGAEGRPTGLKEAVLLERSRGSGEPMQIEGGQLQIPGWNPDYPKHDAEFPGHPGAQWEFSPRIVRLSSRSVIQFQ
jgi:hypothetical protein